MWGASGSYYLMTLPSRQNLPTDILSEPLRVVVSLRLMRALRVAAQRQGTSVSDVARQALARAVGDVASPCQDREPCR